MAFDDTDDQEQDDTQGQDASQDTSQGGANLDDAPAPQGPGAAVRGAFNTIDTQTGNSINSALQVVKRAMQYGRQKHGLVTGAPPQRQTGGVDDRRGENPLVQNPGVDPLRRVQNSGDEDMNANSGVMNVGVADNGVRPKDMMRGYGQGRTDARATFGFADGGAVPSEDDLENTPPAPQRAIPEEDDLENTSPATPRDQSQYPGGKVQRRMGYQGSPAPLQSEGAIETGNEASGGHAQLLRYLQGADAAEPAQVQALEQSVDPDGTMRAEARKVMAVAAAPNPDEQSKVIAHYRKTYDTYRAVAAAAFEAGDLAKATEYATQGSTNTLTGQSIRFAPTDGGVTATVMDSQGNPVSTSTLTPEQFQEYLHSDPGQYDHVHERGPQKSIESLTRQAQVQGGQGPQAPHDMRPMATAGVGAPGQYQSLPQGYRSPAGPDMTVDSPARDAERARLLTGGHNDDGATAARTKSIMDQEQQRTKNKIEQTKAESPYGVAQERGRATVAAAGERASAVRYTADVRAAAYAAATDTKSQAKIEEARMALQGKLAQVAATNAKTAAGSQANIAVQALKNIQLDKPIPKNIQTMIDALVKPEEGAAAQRQAPQAPAPGPSPQPPRPNVPQPAGGARPAPQGQTPAVGTRQQFKQGWGVWDGKQWVPEGK